MEKIMLNISVRNSFISSNLGEIPLIAFLSHTLLYCCNTFVNLEATM